MLVTVEKAARLSVGRAMGFTALAIGTFMIGMSGDPQLCFKTGGLLALLTTAILLLKASWVLSQPFKSTEVWLLLRQEDRPAEDVAQDLIPGVLRDIYLSFAEHAAVAACVMLGVAIVLGLAGSHAG
jgi:hypothetical protein